jgi:PAS domain S-box-containing protein
MADNLPVMVWLTDQKIIPTYINKQAIDFIGEDFEGKTIQHYIHNDDLDFFKYNLKEVIKTKNVLNCEIRLKEKSNSYKWILVNIVPRISESGEFIGVLGVGLDIHERKEIETKLLESETKFTEITNVIGDGVFMIDKDWNIKFSNPEFSNLLGYSFEELEGNNLHKLLHNHDDSQNGECPFIKVFSTGETVRVPQDYYKNSNNDLIPVSYVLSPIKRNGEIVGCVSVFHDITERLNSEEDTRRFVEELQFNKELMEENANEFARLNEMLLESEDRLKELNASKDKFFSIISHDLRSPFTSIIGFAEVMLEDIDTLDKDEIKEFTSSIYKSSKNIQNLLENLLQWSRVQTGRIEFNPIKFDLNNLANDVVALYQVNAARKKISLVNNIEAEIHVKADKFMIDTVMRNLVSNSIKFTRQGGEISINSEEKPDGFLQVSIKDNGVGMKEEILGKLFKIDEHVTTKGTEKEKGTGIGLILCKEFIEKHNGKIWAESTLGEGSTFNFTLPLSPLE